jgi:uncharacterized protein
MSASRLWSSAEAISRQPLSSELPWLADVYAEFCTKVSAPDPQYPCHFATRGQLDGQNWFTALEAGADSRDGVAELAQAINDFQRRAWTGPKRQSLIAFIGPPEPVADFDREYRRFWNLLSGLAAADERPWPDAQPRDVTDPQWQFCFAGEAWFTFCCSPVYRNRRSRNLGPCMAVIFQVRRVFEGLSGSSPAGQAAKQQVRRQLAGYDTVPAHPHLGDEQHSSSFKWRQYMVPDDQRVLSPEACPILLPGQAPAGGRAGP